jgi:uncharacterized protein (DUF885 family)
MGTVADVSERYVQAMGQLNPIWALFVGVESPAALTDFSPEGSEARAALMLSTLRDLESADAVDEPGRLGRLFLAEQLSGSLALHDAGEEECQVSALAGPQAGIRQSFDLLPKGSDEDWAEVLDRLLLVPGTLDGYRRMLAKGIAGGRVATRRAVMSVADQCATWSGRGAGGRGWFSSMAAAYGDGELCSRLERAAGLADGAYASLGDWLRDEYVNVAAERDGVGEERYKAWARSSLGTDLDAEEAYGWGWEELGRLEAEKSVEADRVQAGADYAQVVEMLGNDRSRGIDGVNAWKAWLQDLTDRTIESLDGMHFDIAEPLRRCEVGIPPEGSAAAPHYTPPGDGFVRPGRIWFPTVGRSWFTTWDLPSIVYHEAVPGHHLQVGAIRLMKLTRAQQVGFNSAHGEGWALYAERFMDEIGGFDKPDFRLGFLSMQAFRAARVVVDIGLHTGRRIPRDWPGVGSGEKWTYEIAVDFIEAASGQNRPMCQSEVQRYLSLPAQATCYKLGERSWLAGRDAARRAGGPAFDLKRWHTDALALGPLGLDDLERELAALAGG